jgi:hypothetical protein
MRCCGLPHNRRGEEEHGGCRYLGGHHQGKLPIPPGSPSVTISVPGDIQSGAIVTVTLVGPPGGTVYPLMVTDINDGADTITVEISGPIPFPAGYAIHYIIINP